MRASGAVAAVVALSLVTPVSTFAADKEACVKASDSAQKNKSSKKLRAARKDLLVCAQEDCPAIVKKDCVDWLAEVDASLPTIVLSAKDGSGNDLVDVKVTVDGEPFADKLDGSAMPIDPGVHTIRWEAQGVPAQESKIVVQQAEKNRTVTVTLGKAPEAPPPPPPPKAPEAPPPPPPATTPAAAYVLGGIGIAGIAGFAYFGLSGRSDVQHLRDTCAPYCDKSDEDPARRKLLAADIALGIGVVSLGIATYMFLSTPKSEQPKSSLKVDATPVAGGATFQLGGAF